MSKLKERLLVALCFIAWMAVWLTIALSPLNEASAAEVPLLIAGDGANTYSTAYVVDPYIVGCYVQRTWPWSWDQAMMTCVVRVQVRDVIFTWTEHVRYRETASL